MFGLTISPLYKFDIFFNLFRFWANKRSMYSVLPYPRERLYTLLPLFCFCFSDEHNDDNFEIQAESYFIADFQHHSVKGLLLFFQYILQPYIVITSNVIGNCLCILVKCTMILCNLYKLNFPIKYHFCLFLSLSILHENSVELFWKF